MNIQKAKPVIRIFLITALSIYLTACGDGGAVDKRRTDTGTPVSDDWRYYRGNLETTGSSAYAWAAQAEGFSVSWSNGTDDGYTSGQNTEARTGDIDGDGVNDLVVVNGENLFIYFGNGATKRVLLPVEIGFSPILEDVTGDGTFEIIVGTESNGDYQVNIYEGDGTLYKNLQTRTGPADDDTSWIRPATFLNGNRLAVSYRAGYPLDSRGLSVIDLDGNEIWFFDIGPIPYWTSVADIDGDGVLEILPSVFTPHNGATGNGTTDDDLYTIVVDTNGTEKIVRIFGEDTEGGANGHSVHIITDLEEDGVYEIVAAVVHYPVYYPGDAQVRILDSTDATVLYQASVGEDAWPQLFVADLDNDGIKEIITSSHVLAQVTVFDNHLGQINRAEVGGVIRSIADVDGDGVAEILMCDGNTVRALDGTTLAVEWSQSIGGEEDDTIKEIIPSNIDSDDFAEIIVCQKGRITVLEGAETATDSEE